MSGTPTIAPRLDSIDRTEMSSQSQRTETVLSGGSHASSGKSTTVGRHGSSRIELRSEADVVGLRRAGALAAKALKAAREACVAGATTQEIDQAAHRAILAGGGEALFLGYRGGSRSTTLTRPAYPASTCISVNEQLVHGVPGARVIADGDLVAIDVGVRLDGWCADSAMTVCVGNVDAQRRALVACAEAMLDHAVRSARPGRRWSSVARELELIAERDNFAIAVDFVGHGIGRELHEPPQVPCSAYRAFVERGDFTLRPGMVLAIEPMLVLEVPERWTSGEQQGDLRGPACSLAADGWTVTLDAGQPSCHCEHTIVITRDGAEILTVDGDPRNADSSSESGRESPCAHQNEYRKAG